MKTFFLLLTLLFISCGQSEPDPNEPVYPGQTKKFDLKSTGSLKYLLLVGIDRRNYQEQFIKINLNKLKDFSFHSGLTLNFTKEAQEFLKDKIIDWDEFKIIFKFSDDTPLINITLETIDSQKAKPINNFKKVIFSLSEEEKHHIWSSINPINLTFLSREKDLIKKEIVLKTTELLVNGTNALLPYTTFWIQNHSCSIKHSEYVFSNSRNGPTTQFKQVDSTYSQDSCLEFANKLNWESNNKKVSYESSPFIFHSDGESYLLKLKPRREIDSIRVRKNQYIDKNHINWFKAHLTWLE